MPLEGWRVGVGPQLRCVSFLIHLSVLCWVAHRVLNVIAMLGRHSEPISSGAPPLRRRA